MSRPDDAAVARLAQTAGLNAEWRDAFGEKHTVAPDVLAGMLERMGLACATEAELRDTEQLLQLKRAPGRSAMVVVDVGRAIELQGASGLKYKIELESGETLVGTADSSGPGTAMIPAIRKPGYHRLSIGERTLTLAVCPQRCPAVPGPREAGGPRAWGIGAQLYSLPGEGAYAQLPRLAAGAAAHGADALAISPAHAMFSADATRISPYSPSSRLMLNVGHIEPASVLGSHAATQAIAALDDSVRGDLFGESEYLRWDRIVPARLSVLRRLFHEFQARASEHQRKELSSFCERGGQALRQHASYEALHEHFAKSLGPACGWRDWPQAFHDPASAAAREFCEQHRAEIDFHTFLQWQAARGLGGAHSTAKEAGMRIGLIADLAIGVDPRGSQVWSRQSEMLVGASVGAPPDIYQKQGQNWGLSTFSPWSLIDNGYEGFIETLRAALAYAGGVRIDHILGYARMWLIEEGADPKDGVYLSYPLHDMLRLLTLEASRASAVVMGENLGTVPEGFNDEIKDRGVMGTSVLWFERAEQDESDEGVAEFNAEKDWPDWSMATSTTHDLPTVAGWWKGRDLEWRKRLQAQESDDAKASEDDTPDPSELRSKEKQQLWERLAKSDGAPVPDDPPTNEVLAFVARTPAPLFMLPLEDLLRIEEQPNFPGYPPGLEEGGYPSWMLSLGVDLDAIWDSDTVRDTIAAVKSARRTVT